MEWTKTQTRLFITFYKQHPCLYDRNQISFKNRVKRELASREIVKSMRNAGTEITVLDVTRKIRSLNAQMRRAQKILRKERMRNPEYNSNFWCFDDLSFLIPSYFTFKNNFGDDESEESMQQEIRYFKNENLEEVEDEGIESSVTSTPSISANSAEQEKVFLNETQSESQKNYDLLESFGKTVICEMKLIKNSRILACLRRKIIMEIYNAQDEDMEQVGE